jgi:GT2 family glycosyltransferase/glycosyltransferase involved in cell wall biosynthesis
MTPERSSSSLDVAVVMVTYNSAPLLRPSFSSLPGALDDVGSWSLVVADNDSADGTVELARELNPEASIVEMGWNSGYAAAINRAVAEVPNAKNILILNPDVRLGSGCARELLAVLDRPGIGITVPKLLDDRGQLQFSQRREPSLVRAVTESIFGGQRAARLANLGEVVGDPRQYEREHSVDWATGAVMMVSRECFDQVGDWDESFFLYSEETDFCLRARDSGFLTSFTPAANAIHVGGESNTNPYLWSLLTLNRVRAFRKRHGTLASSAFWAAATTGEALRAATGSLTHRAGLRALVRPGTVNKPKPLIGPAEPGWICFSAQDWWYHNQAHSDFQLMRRVAERRPVLFINSIGMRVPVPGRSTQFTRRIYRKAKSVLRFMKQPLRETPGFHVLTPIILPFYGSKTLRATNAWLVRNQVRLAARRIGITVSDAVVFVTIPTAWDVVRPMRKSALVANRSDLHSAFGESNQDLIRDLENQLLSHSDVVLYTSHSLMDTESAISGDRAVFLDHGVDFERFSSATGSPHPEVAGISRPIVGFFGGIDDYVVDLDLFKKVASELPDCSLVLVGDPTCSIDELVSMPNVHWLGFRPYEEIPSLGAGFDVALMPWLRNEWIAHSNPIKLKEYLALGLPVVSTDFPEVHHYADQIAIARDPDHFIELIGQALRGNAVGTVQTRKARVERTTWDRLADDLVALGERRVGSS